MSADQRVLPHLSQREHAYLYPIPFAQAPDFFAEEPPRSRRLRGDAVDVVVAPSGHEDLVPADRFEVVAAVDGFVVLRRDRAEPRASRLTRLSLAPLWGHLARARRRCSPRSPSIVGTRSSFVTDESYVQIQLDTLEDTGGWTLAAPAPRRSTRRATPSRSTAPREYSDGFTLYGKHPALDLPLPAAPRGLPGTGGLIALSVAGTVAAAFLAAPGGRAPSRRERPARRSGWWARASPLLFDAFVVHAHTIAAATAALAALGRRSPAVQDHRARWVEPSPGWRRWPPPSCAPRARCTPWHWAPQSWASALPFVGAGDPRRMGVVVGLAGAAARC